MKSLEEKYLDHILIISLFILKNKDIMREKYVSEWRMFAKCNMCWEFKEATTENFYAKMDGELWISSRCKLCDKKYHHERYLKNKDKILDATNKYYHSHRESYLENYKNKRWRRLEYAKKYREEHFDKIMEYREKNKERLAQKNIEWWVYKRRREKYYNTHKDQYLQRKRERKKEMGYEPIHTKTSKFIRKLWIRPKICPICWTTWKVEAHHPDYNKWYEVVFCCTKCHQRIHNWWFECPKPIDLHEYYFRWNLRHKK